MSKKESRKSPEELLQQIEAEEGKTKGGKLKIYLGAAPGVGKTYTMLEDALTERKKGLDVVVGLVESHGRKEIDSFLGNFEIVPRQSVEYRGKQLLEFDIDAALKRDPGLILIDEMAHSNAPGLRHLKRWQDIQELLDRGINVWTTLNVQHIESVKDDVSQIIQAPIQETVPDSMLDRADTIELVDLPPEALLQRLKEGKVYIPHQAALALENFFKKGNLIALREIALRITAKFVSTQVLLYRKGKKISRIWKTKEKILVSIGPSHKSMKIIRAARQLAFNIQAEWIAVYVDSPRQHFSEEKHKSAMQNLAFAQELGAQTRVLSGSDIVVTLLNFAHEQNITLLMIMKHIRKRWLSLFRKSLVDELVRYSGEIDVYIMTEVTEEGDKAKEGSTPTLTTLQKTLHWKSYLSAVGIVGLATGINFLLALYFNTSNLILVYLLAVASISMLFGQFGPSLLGSILSVLLYIIFFISPNYSFSILNIEYFITLLVMLLVAQIINHLTILTRQQIFNVTQAEQKSSALLQLSQQLASARGADKLLEMGTDFISKLFDCKVVALIPENNHLTPFYKHRGREPLTEKEMSVAQWVFDLGQMAGHGTHTLPSSNALYIPLQGSHKVLGVLKIQCSKIEQFNEPQQLRLLETCANQIALAIEVDSLQEQSKQSQMKEETNKVRNTLLQSISHDLRIPILAAMGMAAQLTERTEPIDRKSANKIGDSIYKELEQLNRLISNLLQIAYLESASVKLEMQYCSLKDIIAHVIELSKPKLGKRTVAVVLPENLPLVPVDRVLIEDVFINLIDNAIKFTDILSPIEITVAVQAIQDKVLVCVEDTGPGIVRDEIDKLFEKFYRGRLLTTERGLGLGLAICKKIISAHGGEIWAENRETKGAAFFFTIPLKGSHYVFPEEKMQSYP